MSQMDEEVEKNDFIKDFDGYLQMQPVNGKVTINIYAVCCSNSLLGYNGQYFKSVSKFKSK